MRTMRTWVHTFEIFFYKTIFFATRFTTGFFHAFCHSASSGSSTSDISFWAGRFGFSSSASSCSFTTNKSIFARRSWFTGTFSNFMAMSGFSTTNKSFFARFSRFSDAFLGITSSSFSTADFS